jgi:hypothetical protein
MLHTRPGENGRMAKIHVAAVWPDTSTGSCISLARADNDPAHFAVSPLLVSKYVEAVVGGADMVAVEKPWPSVCGCRAKTLNLLKSNAIALSVQAESSTCDLERERRHQSRRFDTAC